jgi:hypothetical protein
MNKEHNPLASIISRLAGHLDDAVCIAIMLNADRDMFIEMAEKAFDCNLKWHKDFIEEDEKEKAAH